MTKTQAYVKTPVRKPSKLRQNRADLTLFHFSFLLKLATLSKSSPDFQLLLLVAAPDKQNLLDQADFTAAPAHMAASVAHSLR